MKQSQGVFLGLLLCLLLAAAIIHPWQFRYFHVLQNLGQYQGAEEESESLLQNGDTNRLALQTLIDVEGRLSHWDRQIALMQILYGKYPKYTPYFQSLLEKELWYGQRKQALNLLLDHLKYSPLNPEQWHMVDLLAREQGRDTLVIAILKQRLNRDGEKIPFLREELILWCWNAGDSLCLENLAWKRYLSQSQNPEALRELGQYLFAHRHTQQLQNLVRLQTISKDSIWFKFAGMLHLWHQDSILDTRLEQWSNQDPQHRAALAIRVWQSLGNDQQIHNYLLDLSQKHMLPWAGDSLSNWEQRHGNYAEQIRLELHSAQAQRSQVDEAWFRSRLQWIPNPRLRAQVSEELIRARCRSDCPEQLMNDLWQITLANPSQNPSQWLWDHRSNWHNIWTKDRVINLLPMSLDLDEQDRWLARAAKSDTDWLRNWAVWNLHVGWNNSRAVKWLNLVEQLPDPLRHRVADSLWNWFDAQGNSQAQNQLLPLWQNASSKRLRILQNQRQGDWSQQKWIALAQVQGEILAIKNHLDSNDRLAIRDLWWNQHHKEAEQLWTKAWTKGEMGDEDLELLAKDSSTAPQWRPLYLHRLHDLGGQKDLIFLIQIGDWEDLRRAKLTGLEEKSWWNLLQIALEHHELDWIEKQLDLYPNRRQHIPQALGLKLQQVAQEFLEAGKTGPANYWFQVAKGGGW